MENSGNQTQTCIQEKSVEGTDSDFPAPPYENLTTEQKLEVARLLCHHSIDHIFARTNRSGKELYPPTIEEFYASNCTHMHPGRRNHGLHNARLCYYCVREMTPYRPEGSESSDPLRRTIDHFYAKSSTPYKGKRAKLVICCNRCNHWKANQMPEAILYRYYSLDGASNAGWPKGTRARIRKVIADIESNSGPQAYYIE